MRWSHARQRTCGWLAAAWTGVAALGPGARAQELRPPDADPPSARAPVPSGDLFATNLGISYQLVPYGRAYGARLTQDPIAGSPAAQLQLEPGDLITTLDGQPIYGPDDVLNHTAHTTLVFVNIRTGRPQSGAVFIPSPGPPPGPGPGPRPPYVLGVVTVPVTLDDGGAAYSARRPGPDYNPNPGGTVPIPGLRITQVTYGSAAQRAGLEVGDTIVTINQAPATDPQTLRRVIARSGGVLNLTVKNGRPPYSYVDITANLRLQGPVPYGTPTP